MHIPPLHAWPQTAPEAEALQVALRARWVAEPIPTLTADTLIAGCDLAYEKNGERCFAAVVLTRNFGAEVLETRTAEGLATFEYVPGLLSFREIPMLLKAFEQLDGAPDLVMCDGQGAAHPRRFGLACHLGLWLDRPTMGCAKSRFVGTHSTPPVQVGSTPLMDGAEVIGAVVRRIEGVKPVYVSAGHRCDLDGAIDAVIRGAGPYRIPEPVRAADLLTYQLRRAAEA
jgi:deoxyribonuclease V